MQASGEHNITLFNSFNKFSNEPAWIYHIFQNELVNGKTDHFFTDTLLYNAMFV